MYTYVGISSISDILCEMAQIGDACLMTCYLQTKHQSCVSFWKFIIHTLGWNILLTPVKRLWNPLTMLNKLGKRKAHWSITPTLKNLISLLVWQDYHTWNNAKLFRRKEEKEPLSVEPRSFAYIISFIPYKNGNLVVVFILIIKMRKWRPREIKLLP